MNLYDDVLEPSVIQRGLSARFTTLTENELILLRTNIISIYQVLDTTGELLLKHEYRFDGVISDIQVVPQGTGKLDTLLLCLNDCKFSLIRFDANNNILETLSLHYYGSKFKKQSLIQLSKTSTVRIDPNNNCILLFNGDNIAVLPILNNEANDDEIGDMENIDEIYPSKKKLKNNYNHHFKTGASEVISSKALNVDIQNIIDIQFLYNFSKPTVTILYQPKLAWIGNKKLNSQPTKIQIISFNFILSEGKTTIEPTLITKLENLSWDYHTLLPITNGILIVGDNELSFMDNTGVLQSCIFLNSFSDKNWRLSKIIDNSHLEIILTKNMIKSLSVPSRLDNNKDSSINTDTDELLLIMDQLNNLYYIQFEFEGRLLIKFDIIKLPILNDIFTQNNCITCIVRVDNYKDNSNINLFLGFQTGNSMVVKLNNIKSVLTSKEEKDDTDRLNSAMDEDEDFYDEDDLYANDESIENVTSNSKSLVNKSSTNLAEPFDIELLSVLNNTGPITSLTTGKVTSIETNIKGLTNPNKDEYSIVTTSGNGTGSHLNVVQLTVQPVVELALKFISVTQTWNLKLNNIDKYLVTTDSTKTKSDIYEIDNNFSLHRSGRLRRDATTVNISIFGDQTRIVQVTTNNLYLFDTNFRRLTTIKFDYEIVHVSFMDPYILITLSRGNLYIYELEKKYKKKLFRVGLPEILSEMVITSGLILKSNMCNEFLPQVEDKDEEQMLFTFVTADNQIIFFTREHNDRVFQLNGVDDLAEQLFISTYTLPDEVVPDPSIKQIMINKLGQNYPEEYLTILTFGGEIYQYKKSLQRNSRFYKNSIRNNLAVTGAPNNAYAKGVSSIERILHYIPNYNGYSVIFVTGNVPYIIMKEDNSVSRVFKFANISIVSMTPWGKQSIMCVDDIKNARVYTLDKENVYYGNKLPIKKVFINTTIENYMTLTNITYHEKSQTFMASYMQEIDFVAKSEDDEPITVGVKDNVPHAKGSHCGLLLINPQTWNIIDKVEFDGDAMVNDMKTMLIQVDSHSKRKVEFLVVGVTNNSSEDLPASGSFFIYDIISVVPEPGKPDTGFKLKQIFTEYVKSAITATCDISGRFVISQSQKLMVRDVQEDNSVVPVAFLDVPLYVTNIKSFGNLLLIGDAMQGIQFIGFDAEPYRMIPLGKSVTHFETMCIEFIINNGELYFAIVDINNILHVLKYAPDEPNSLSGQRLIHCSSFNLYSSVTCMKLIPKNNEFDNSNNNTGAINGTSSFQIIGGHIDGSLHKIIPLSEDAYRRLYVIQQQIIDKEPTLGGLNPRMERQGNDFLHLSHTKRVMLDYNVIKRFTTLSIKRRSNLAQKIGRNAEFDLWRIIIDTEFSMVSLTPRNNKQTH